MKPSILVVGSSNTDMVIKTDHLPMPGETILGGTFFMNPGGKGANQAVAAARLGGDITFIAKTGNDIFGEQAVQLFKKEGINTSYLLSDPVNPSGVALITVDSKGENCIAVASGSNGTLGSEDLQSNQQIIQESSIVLMQLEIPLATVAYVADIAAAANRTVVLNPAPAQPLSEALLRNVTIITPNETEAEILTGIKVDSIDSAKQAAEVLHGKGIEIVIITLGAKGALVFENGEFIHVPTISVNAVDTTAAGDVFNGALVVALSEGKPVVEAVAFGCRAAAISVTRLGAQAAAPYRHEADNLQLSTSGMLQ